MGKALIFFCTSLLTIQNGTFAQLASRPVAGMYHSLHQFASQKSTVFAPAYNQAALAQAKTFAAGLYTERRYMLNELSVYHLAIVLPVATGGFGLNGFYSGSSQANTSILGLGYGRSLGESVDVGLQFNYTAYRVQGYGQASAVNAEAGAVFHLGEKLHAGIHALNPAGGKVGKSSAEKMPSVYSFGLGYQAGDNFLMAAIIQKEEDQPVNFQAGMAYWFHQQFVLKAGITTATGIVWGGIGMQFKNLRLDIVSAYHPTLGITPGIAFSFQPKQQQN